MSEKVKIMEKEIKSNQTVYKSCLVPSCKNTTTKAPEKVYLQTPNNPNKRKNWCIAIGIPEKNITKKNYVCEDHFVVRIKVYLISNLY